MKYVNAGTSRMPLVSLVAILSVSLVINLPGLAVSPMLERLHEIFHTSEVESQLITSLPNLCIIPATIITGRLTTVRYQTGVLITGLSLFLAAGTVCFFARSIGVLIAMGCFVGIGCGMVVPLAAGFISEWFWGSIRQRDLGLKSTVSNTMVVIANIYVGCIAVHSWRAAFAVYLFPLIPLALVPFMTQGYINAHRQPTAPTTAATAPVTTTADHFQGYASRRLLWMVCLLYLVLTYCTTSISYYAPFTMKAYGMDTTQAGVVTAMYYLMCAVSGCILSRLKTLFGPNIIPISLGIVAAGLLVMGFTHNFWLYTFMSLFIGFAYGIIQPIIYNKTTYIAPDHKEGTRFFGYVLAMNYLGIMLVPFVDGFFRGVFKSQNPAFEFLFSGFVVIILLIWSLMSRRTYVFAVNPTTAAPTPQQIASAEK